MSLLSDKLSRINVALLCCPVGNFEVEIEGHEPFILNIGSFNPVSEAVRRVYRLKTGKKLELSQKITVLELNVEKSYIKVRIE